MKNQLLIDLDSERQQTIIIAKPAEFPRPTTAQLHADMVLFDMATLCEAICTMIHLAEQEKIKSSADSVRDCINHIQQGFADPDYKAYTQNPT